MRISKTLPDLTTRLERKDISGVELVQRKAFAKILTELCGGGGHQACVISFLWRWTLGLFIV